MHRSAFSLVELSIVLVILGLLVGGVLSGQSLIRAAETRAVVAEYNKFTTATLSFRDKYFAIPGDMTNASSFWGLAAAGAACITTVGTGTQTCDGNGNGYQDGSTNSYEDLRAWQHLSNAGLIEGKYNGVADITDYYKVNVNSPPSKAGPIFLWGTYGIISPTAGTVFYFPQKAGNYFGIWSVNSAPFTPSEAWNIDTKIDDGKPGTGKAQSAKGDVANPCATGAGLVTTPTQDAAAVYQLNVTAKTCELDFDIF